MHSGLLGVFTTHQALLPGFPEADTLLSGPGTDLVLTKLAYVAELFRQHVANAEQPGSLVAYSLVKDWMGRFEEQLWETLEMAMSIGSGGVYLAGETDWGDEGAPQWYREISHTWESAWKDLEESIKEDLVDMSDRLAEIFSDFAANALENVWPDTFHWLELKKADGCAAFKAKSQAIDEQVMELQRVLEAQVKAFTTYVKKNERGEGGGLLAYTGSRWEVVEAAVDAMPGSTLAGLMGAAKIVDDNYAKVPASPAASTAASTAMPKKEPNPQHLKKEPNPQHLALELDLCIEHCTRVLWNGALAPCSLCQDCQKPLAQQRGGHSMQKACMWHPEVCYAHRQSAPPAKERRPCPLPTPPTRADNRAMTGGKPGPDLTVDLDELEDDEVLAAVLLQPAPAPRAPAPSAAPAPPAATALPHVQGNEACASDGDAGALPQLRDLPMVKLGLDDVCLQPLPAFLWLGVNETCSTQRLKPSTCLLPRATIARAAPCISPVLRLSMHFACPESALTESTLTKFALTRTP